MVCFMLAYDWSVQTQRQRSVTLTVCCGNNVKVSRINGMSFPIGLVYINNDLKNNHIHYISMTSAVRYANKLTHLFLFVLSWMHNAQK